jgi:hypothetical protein
LSGYFKRGKSGSSTLEEGKPYSKVSKTFHTVVGLGLLIEFLEEVMRKGVRNHHSPVVQYLEGQISYNEIPGACFETKLI